MPSFGLGDIRRTIPEAAFARAERYVRQGRVCAAGPGEEAGSLIGRVQGTERKPYEQHIRVIIEGRACRIIGLCSCPVGANCKHVGAVLLTALEESPSDHAIPLAAALQKPRRKDIAPKPHLRLMTARLDYRRTRYWQMPDGDMMAIARLSFDYGGARVGSGDKERALTAVDGDQVFSIPRDLTAETRFRARLEDLGFERIDALGLYEVTPEGLSDFIMIGPDPEEELMDPEQALLDFSHHHLPLLRAEGWIVDVDEDYPIHLAEAGDDWFADVQESAGIDWFGVDLGILVDGERISVLPPLLDFLEDMRTSAGLDDLDRLTAGATTFVPIEDGRFLPLPSERLRPLLAALFELFELGAITEDGAIRLNPVQAADLADLAATTAAINLRWLGGERLLELGARL